VLLVVGLFVFLLGGFKQYDIRSLLGVSKFLPFDLLHILVIGYGLDLLI